MTIWIDADACPKPVREILYRASQRLNVPICLVANSILPVPNSDLISAVRVPPGFDKADKYIAQEVAEDDLVITADIPLAAEIVRKGAVALDPRGELYTDENVEQRLTMRNLLEELRDNDVITGGPKPFSQSDRQAFAAALDRFLSKRLKGRRPGSSAR